MVSRTSTEPDMDTGNKKKKALQQSQMSLRTKGPTSVDVDAGDKRPVPVPNLSKHLSSPTVKVQVGDGSDIKIFYIHQSLIDGKLFPDLPKNCLEESQEPIYNYPEENVDVFDLFVQFIYGVDLPHDLSAVALVGLYGFGIRSDEPGLRDAAVARMPMALGLEEGTYNYLDDNEVCDLLELMANEIPEPDENDDAMANLVLWYAARRLTRLRKMDYFLSLINEYPEISCGVLLKASNAEYVLPGHGY